MPYADLTFAEEYFADRAYTDNWDNASDADKQKILSTATAFIERFCQFYDIAGMPFLYSIEGAEDWLKEACCEEALYLLNLGFDPTQPPEPTVLGIASTKGTVFDKSMTADILCQSCRVILEYNGGEISPDAISGNGGSVAFGNVVK